jgi:hypothetical protein
MNMNVIATTLQREINSETNPASFPNWMEQKYPELVKKLAEDEGYEAMVDSLEPRWVESHERENKDGGVSIVKGYWKQPKPMTAMDLALLEADEENGEGTGLNLEAELEEYMNALASGAISLGQMQ